MSAARTVVECIVRRRHVGHKRQLAGRFLRDRKDLVSSGRKYLPRASKIDDFCSVEEQDRDLRRGIRLGLFDQRHAATRASSRFIKLELVARHATWRTNENLRITDPGLRDCVLTKRRKIADRGRCAGATLEKLSAVCTAAGGICQVIFHLPRILTPVAGRVLDV